MSQSKITKRLGTPDKIIEVPEKRALEVYVDHYWTRDPVLGVKGWPMWVYQHDLAGGGIRKVYLFFDNRNRLYGWGYDHAHEEADRYLQRTTRKSE